MLPAKDSAGEFVICATAVSAWAETVIAEVNKQNTNTKKDKRDITDSSTNKFNFECNAKN
jgi:hypothetical protein